MCFEFSKELKQTRDLSKKNPSFRSPSFVRPRPHSRRSFPCRWAGRHSEDSKTMMIHYNRQTARLLINQAHKSLNCTKIIQYFKKWTLNG